MELKWFGTAGFEIKTAVSIFLLDPYVSRNEKAFPVQRIRPSDIVHADRIFISHGHFDHVMDLPQIAQNIKSHIHCSVQTSQTLVQNRVHENQISPVEKEQVFFKFSDYTAQPFFCRHVRFDTRLVLSTLLKMHSGFFTHLPLLTRYPCGQVLAWRFVIQNRVLVFFGSAGVLNDALISAISPVDILLLPMQGHSKICDIGLEYVKRLKPDVVIPHHFDNFYPPVSKFVSLVPFVDGITEQYPETKLIIPTMNETIHL